MIWLLDILFRFMTLLIGFFDGPEKLLFAAYKFIYGKLQ